MASRRFAACVLDNLTQTCWQVMQRDSDCCSADSGKPGTFLLCEKKHQRTRSNASTSLKTPLLVWDCEFEQCARVKTLAKLR